MSTFSITCDLDPKLHAHAKGHWREKASATKRARRLAAELASLACAEPLAGRAVVDYRFRVPDRRRRDLANLIHACKPLVDGVVDAGLLRGDHWEVLAIGSVSVAVVGERVGVELVFRSEL